jgi:hypothetical protein
VYTASQRDLLVFRSRATAFPLTGEALRVDDMAYGRASDPMVVLASIYPDGADGLEEEQHLLAITGRSRVEVALDPAHDVQEVVVSGDGESLVAWGTRGWQLRRTDNLRPLGREASRKRTGSASSSELRILRVRPFGPSDFLLLDRRGLSLLRGSDGKRTPIREPQCAATSALDTHACVAATERPGHPGHILILRRDGKAELWDLHAGRRAGPVADFGANGIQLAVRSDGARAAVTTAAGTWVWWPDTANNVGLGDDVQVVGPFHADGRILVSRQDSKGGGLELWDTKTRTSLASVPLLSPYGLWRLDHGTLSAGGDHGWISVSLQPLTGNDRTLCEQLADYPGVEVWTLPGFEDAAADAWPDCPARVSGRAQGHTEVRGGRGVGAMLRTPLGRRWNGRLS